MIDTHNITVADRIQFWARTGMRDDYWDFSEEYFSLDAPQYIPNGSCIRIDFSGMNSVPFASVDFVIR